MKTKTIRRALLLIALGWVVCGTPRSAQAQSFTNYAAGDDVTTSLGQFQIVLDSRWRKIFDLIIPNSPLGNVQSTRHIRLYHNGVFTSPTLYEQNTLIGRSESFLHGAPEETFGALAGRAPGRTYIRDDQLVVLPPWSGLSNGVRVVHTFLKSMHLTDSLTTRFGFSVKAGLQAPTRPVSAGQVQGGDAGFDFPARSFFNVYVVVDLPSGGLLPPIQLVNVDPLLVQQTNVTSFPPRLVYQHENSTAVSLYFHTNCVIPDVENGTNIFVPRGTLFGQLTLAGHGVGFSSAEVESFQNEFENESGTSSMPVNAAPDTSVVIQDFAPDYNAAPPTLGGGHFLGDGTFVFTLGRVPSGITNYLQVSTDLLSGNWMTIATNITSTNLSVFMDPNPGNVAQKFYRLTWAP